MGEMRVDLYRHESVAMLQRFMSRQKNVGGISNVLNRNSLENNFRSAAILRVFREAVVINITPGDRPIENRRVGGDATYSGIRKPLDLPARRACPG